MRLQFTHAYAGHRHRGLGCRATVVPIKGDVEGIQRAHGRTEVLVNEGLTTTSYALDEALVTFGAALEQQVGPGSAQPLGGGQALVPVARCRRLCRCAPTGC